MTLIATNEGGLSVQTADSIEEFIRRIGFFNTKQRLYFRGLPDVEYDLSPSVGRYIDETKETWLLKESRLIQFAQQSFPDLFKSDYPTILISNLQHYGINTRMLDVTGNALVALYFACRYDPEKDGKVVIFEGMPVSSYNPYANIIADTYRLTNNAQTSIDKYLYLIFSQQYSSSLVYPGWENDLNNRNSIIQCINKPLLIDVGYINIRQRNQDGKFLLFPNRIDNNKILNELVKIDVMSSDMVKAEIRIPKGSKEEILRKLKYLGITDGFIFPDDVKIMMDQVKELLKREE